MDARLRDPHAVLSTLQYWEPRLIAALLLPSSPSGDNMDENMVHFQHIQQDHQHVQHVQDSYQ